MSRSSGEGRRVRPSHGVRAQVEPLAALAAVLAVSLGLGIYTGALHAAIPVPEDRQHAPTALDAVADRVGDDTGVLAPESLPAATAVAPDGRRLNATLTADDRRWHLGPPIPAAASDRASRRVPVRVVPNRTAVGRLRVVVW